MAALAASDPAGSPSTATSPLVRVEQPADYGDRGCLPRAVGAEQPVALVVAHGEGDTVEGRALAEPLLKALTRKHGWTRNLDPRDLLGAHRRRCRRSLVRSTTTIGGTVESVIRLDGDRFEPDVVTGLDAFSHLCVVFQFHLVDEADIVSGARRPRGNPDWPKVGMFAERAKMRPNRLGVSHLRLSSPCAASTCTCAASTRVDGTPVLDVKPFFREFEPDAESAAGVGHGVDGGVLLIGLAVDAVGPLGHGPGPPGHGPAPIEHGPVNVKR